MANFWERAKEKIKPEVEEEVIDLQQKLSKLDLTDVNYIYNMMINGNYRGRELEQATTTYLKIKFIKANLEANSEQEETKNS
jgi:hypothetical protein|tara:strand:- start:297 stop:542 length:246 start_codon:yes stop_codon:yes gene_type:complete